MRARTLIWKIVAGLFAGLILASGFSCSHTDNSKVTDEGVIEYDAKAVDQSHPWAGMAPSNATLKFKKDKFVMEMSTMGVFNTMFICDLQAKTLTQMVKFLDIKQAHVETEKDIREENAKYKLHVEETKDTKMIAGYKCHKVKVTMADDPKSSFEAWYTREMDLANVNDLSPYQGVKGMLMEYRLKRMGLEMQFTARSVKKEQQADNTFEVPDCFKLVSKEDLEKIFSSLQ